MRYLLRPSAAEELSVRGRYHLADLQGKLRAIESWEWYRQDGSPVEVLRSEWSPQESAGERLLAHAVVSPGGLERLKLRLVRQGTPSQSVTVTTMPDSVLVNDEGTFSEVDLPAGYGLFTPLPSLARLAFPFDLASEQQEVAMLYFLRVRAGRLEGRPIKFGYTPLGLRDFEVKGETLRGKGWRMEVPGLPAQEGWFDRNGSCLFWHVDDPRAPWEARLVDWMKFG